MSFPVPSSIRSSIQSSELRHAAPRLLGATAAAGLLLIGAACSSASADDQDATSDDSLTGSAAAASLGDALVAVVGPAVGPVEPEVVIDETPPGLAVISPAPGSRVDSASYVFEGFTEPGATVVVGDVETIATESGRWSARLDLNEGPNTTVVKTTDAAGNEFHKEVLVNFEKPKPVAYEPPKEEHKPKPEGSHEEKPEAKPVKEEHHEFTAWTKFGICTTEPFSKTGGEGSKDTDVLTKFKGHGIPGTAVTVVSEYGGGIAEVDDSGYWWIKVEFSDGAAETEFTAVVTSGDHVARFRCGLI